MARRIIKLIVSIGVRIVDWLTWQIGCWARRTNPGRCVVINYHVVSDHFKDHFRRQMELMIKVAKPISAVKARELATGVSYVALTVDDAFSSFARNAWPILRELQIPVTVFVPTSFLGCRSAWVDYGGENPVGEDVIDAETLCLLAENDLMDVGSHTANHADLVRLEDDDVLRELGLSRETLQTMLGRTIDSISFPYGSFGQRECRMAQEAGYRFMFSVLPEMIVSSLSGRLMGRISVQPTDWPIEFRLKVLGAYRWVAGAAAWKQRLRLLFGHHAFRQTSEARA